MYSLFQKFGEEGLPEFLFVNQSQLHNQYGRGVFAREGLSAGLTFGPYQVRFFPAKIYSLFQNIAVFYQGKRENECDRACHDAGYSWQVYGRWVLL